MISLALGLVLAAAPPFAWPKPELVEEIDVPDAVQADGIPVRMRIIRSKQGVQQLLQTYANAFVKAGFWVPVTQKRLLAEPHLTGLDVHGFTSYSVILRPNADGTTTCVLGEAALAAKQKRKDFAPLFPGARDVLRSDQEFGRVITALAKAAPPEVQRFYRELLPTAGFKPVDGEVDAWERGAERLTLSVQGGPGGTNVVLLLKLTGGSR